MKQGPTTSGRWARKGPDLQRIERGTFSGRIISETCNFEDIERRILAHQGFYDFHETTASELFDVSPEDVTKDQREFAKLWNHMRSYSTTAFPEVIKKGYRIPH